MRGSRPQWALCVLAAGLLAAACAAARADLGLDIYRNPQAAVCGERLYLFARAVRDGEKPCLCIREETDGQWKKLGELRADYSAIAQHEGKFYLFLPQSVTEIDAETCKKTREAPWQYNWRAQSVEIVDGTLFAYGVGGDGQLYVASAPMAEAETEEPPAPEATSPPAGGSTPPAAGSTPPGGSTPPVAARSGPCPDLLAQGKDWEKRLLEPGAPSEGEGACTKVRALRVGETLWLFWTVQRAGKGEVLKAAALTEKGLGPGHNIADTEEGTLQFAAAAFAGEPLIISAMLPARLAGEHHLRYWTRSDGRWLPSEVAAAVGNPFSERTHTLNAVAVGGRIHLFLGTDYRVLRSIYDGQAWSPVETILADPSLELVIQHMAFVTAAMVAGILVLLASAIRSRFLPRRAEIGGVEYVLASWPRRAAAYACDFGVVFFSVTIIHRFAGVEAGTSAFVLAFFCFELFYFSMLEARAGRTLGKRLFGVIVVSRNGGYPTGSESLIRNLPRALGDALAIPLGWFVGTVVMFNTRGSQRTGDLAAGTYVVKEHKTD